MLGRCSLNMSVLQVFVVFELVLRMPLLEDLAFQSSVCLLGITKVCNGKLIQKHQAIQSTPNSLTLEDD